MTQQLSTALCNALLSGGSDFRTIFANGSVILFAGSGVPALADSLLSSVSAVEVVRCTLPGSAGIGTMTTAVGGVISKKSTDTWTGTVSTSLTVIFYRLMTANEVASTGGLTYGQDDTMSHACARVQGTIGTGGADMNLGNVSLTSGAGFVLNYFTEAIVPS